MRGGPQPVFNLHPVDGKDPAVQEVLGAFNDIFPDDFYPLEREHFEQGEWVVVTADGQHRKLVAFAGGVPFRPFNDFFYFKRVAVIAEYRGQSLQRQLMQHLEGHARKRGYTHMISTTDIENIYSANNFVRTGWTLTKPEKPWEPSSLYWIKKL